MSDDKKKPDELGKLSDEDLSGVAGGWSKVEEDSTGSFEEWFSTLDDDPRPQH